VRKTKTGIPGRTEGLSTGGGRDGRKRDSLSPSSGAIHDGENLGVALGMEGEDQQGQRGCGKNDGKE
jgi:hypothetical protein